jgi:hypothetical protein
MGASMIDKIAKSAASQPIQFAIGVAIVGVVGYFLVKRAAGVAAATAVGVVAGDNALTQGTPYQGAGVLGTLGAAANAASGGHLRSIGESLGGWVYDLTHSEYDASSGLKSAPKTVADGRRATDRLWGPVGSVELRTTF